MGTHGTRSKNSLLDFTAAGVWFSACVMVLALIEGHAAGQCVEHKLLASDGAVFDSFGSSVSITGAPGYEVVIVGADRNDFIGSGSGAAYIFELAACPADTDCSGDVNVTDLILLLGSWGPCPAPCPADTNSDGAVNVTELIKLLAAWGPCSVP